MKPGGPGPGPGTRRGDAAECGWAEAGGSPSAGWWGVDSERPAAKGRGEGGGGGRRESAQAGETRTCSLAAQGADISNMYGNMLQRSRSTGTHTHTHTHTHTPTRT